MNGTQDSPLGAGGSYELLGPPVLSVASWLLLKLARRSTNSQTPCKAPGQRESLAPVGRLTGHRGLGLAPLRGCLFLPIQTGGEMMDGLKRRGLEPQAGMGWRTDQLAKSPGDQWRPSEWRACTLETWQRVAGLPRACYTLSCSQRREQFWLEA